MNMRYVIILIICSLLIINIGEAYKCSYENSPKFNILENEDLYENQNYIKIINTDKLDYFSYFIINSSINNFGIDTNKRLINFTPSINEWGKHLILFIAINDKQCYSTILTTFYVYDIPKIIPLYPNTNYLTLTEGENYNIKIRIDDKDNDIYKSSWYLNNKKQSSNKVNEFIFATKYNSSGIYNLSVIVQDIKKLNDTFEWKIYVKEKNRPPYLFSEIPNYAVEQDNSISIANLDLYFKDPDNDSLSYEINAHDQNGKAIDLETYIDKNNLLKINTPKNITGVISIEIIVKDTSGETVKSNIFTLNIFNFKSLYGLDLNYTAKCLDNVCSINETCNTCEPDCGPCNEYELKCSPDWECTEWGECILPGFMFRTCTEENGCYDKSSRPVTVKKCDKIESCFDKIKNHNEIGIDCGGACKPCPSCNDYKQNQGEKGIDCGGPCDTICPACNDYIKNQFESDIDCGGICGECDDLKKCYTSLDCKSHICYNNTCLIPTCFDNVTNQDEKGTDCEGICKKVCPTCFDGIRNQGEEGIDCGWNCNNVCSTCFDNIKNQNENLIDCGGICNKCKFSDFRLHYSKTWIVLIITGLLIFISAFIFLMDVIINRILINISIKRLLLFYKIIPYNNELFDKNKNLIDKNKNLIDKNIDFIKNLLDHDINYNVNKDKLFNNLANILEELFDVNISMDESVILSNLSENGFRFPLNRLIFYLIETSKSIKLNNHMPDSEIRDILEKIMMILKSFKNQN